MRREQLKLVHPGDGGADCEPKVIDTVGTPTSNLVAANPLLCSKTGLPHLLEGCFAMFDRPNMG